MVLQGPLILKRFYLEMCVQKDQAQFNSYILFLITEFGQMWRPEPAGLLS